MSSTICDMPPKKVGRPVAEDPLVNRGFRSKQSEWDALVEKAAAEGMTTSQWIRATLNAAS